MKACLALVLLAAGCTAGKKFQMPKDDDLALGRTSVERVFEIMGPPFKESSLSQNGKAYRVLTYVYVKSGSQRMMVLVFLDNRLVGKDSLSSFESDHTNFDDRIVSQIQKGVSLGKDVVRLLGKPGGRQVPPLAPEGSEVLIWSYAHGNRERRYMKQLKVTLGREDVVTDVTLVENGTK